MNQSLLQIYVQKLKFATQKNTRLLRFYSEFLSKNLEGGGSGLESCGKMGQISIENMSWTFNNLFLSNRSNELEKELFHHIGAETQGFQGLFDQSD